VLSPDDEALRDLSSDFWATALWAARRLRKGDVFLAVDAINGALKRSVVTLLGWHAISVDPEASVLEAGRGVERWADPGALSALERAYADYDLRDAARALWATIGLFQGLEEETAQRLGLAVELDHADLRRRVAEVVPDPRRGSTLTA
jgi:aminoglycoside 6-adenylyltransferase